MTGNASDSLVSLNSDRVMIVNPSEEGAILLVCAAQILNIIVKYSKESNNSNINNSNNNNSSNKSYLDRLAELSLPIDISKWILLFQDRLSFKLDYSKFLLIAQEMDQHLKFRLFILDSPTNSPTIADIIIWYGFKNQPVWLGKKNEFAFYELFRWYEHVYTFIKESIDKLNVAIKSGDSALVKKDQGSFDIELPDAEYGKVVTRFPPEPSGYLHIGHAKAALLNQYFAQHFNGKLIVRFDDTNPTKENVEFEDSILEDLEMIGVRGNVLSHTSDYFDQIEEMAFKLIKDGKAYADDTVQEEMRDQRFHGIPSKSRDLTIEENLARFNEMRQGSPFGKSCCLRAKIDMQAPNKALRDPVIYRCVDDPHHRTGTRFKIYPTYDFACPIVDSLEGVTHALRTNEYRDRNDQYYWIIDALGLRKPFIWDYSRVNFVYTLLSKRKMIWFVQKNLVSGWDDPRMPTIRGIRRRGLTIEALREYILMQGASKNAVMLEWDKIWAVNKRIIDPISPRHTALIKNDLCKIKLQGFEDETNQKNASNGYTKEMAKHKKNPSLGFKRVNYSSNIFIEQEDAKSLEEGEEITLMDWGNVIIEKIKRDQDQIIEIEAKLHLEGDFKKTKKKLTWLSPDPQPLITVFLYDYDYLITKKKMEEEDNLEDCITAQSEFINEALGDAGIALLAKGDVIQLERKGFYICDSISHSSHDDKDNGNNKDNGNSGNNNDQKISVKLIKIPDGKAASVISKSVN